MQLLIQLSNYIRPEYLQPELMVSLGHKGMDITVLAVTNSLCWFVSNQVQYNMESAQYLG